MSKKNNSFSVKFNAQSQSFTPVFTKQISNFNTDVKPKVNSTEEIYYDEIVIYDGGGVEGYGND